MKKRLMKTIVWLVVLVMLIGMMAGCGGSSKTPDGSQSQSASSSNATKPSEVSSKPYEGKSITVLLESHGSVDGAKAQFDKFTDETGITVNPENFAYEEMIQKILLNFSSGSDEYDVVMNDTYQTATYTAGNYVRNLLDFSSNSAINQYFDENDFIPAYLDTCKRDGKLYSLPVYGESLFLMYRKDLFEEYGISVPTTMEDMVMAAKTVTEKSDGKIAGITLRGMSGIHAIYIWSSFLWGNGGRWFDENGKMDVATPEAIGALETYSSLLQNYGPKGYANFGWEENRLLFQKGNAAMTIDATVNGAYCEDPSASAIAGKVGYAEVPAFKGAKSQGGNHSLATHGLFVSNFSKNPEAGWLFASWMTSKDVQTQSFQNSPHCGVTSLGSIKSDEFQEMYGMFADGMLAAVAKGNTGYYPQNEYAQEIVTRVGTALNEVLAGSKSAKDALTKVNNEVNTEVIK